MNDTPEKKTWSRIVPKEGTMEYAMVANLRYYVAADEAERKLKHSKTNRQPTQKEFWDALRQRPDFNEIDARAKIILPEILPVKPAKDSGELNWPEYSHFWANIGGFCPNLDPFWP